MAAMSPARPGNKMLSTADANPIAWFAEWGDVVFQTQATICIHGWSGKCFSERGHRLATLCSDYREVSIDLVYWHLE